MGQWVVCWLDGVLGQIPSEPTRYLGQTDNSLAIETNVSLSPVFFYSQKTKSPLINQDNSPQRTTNSPSRTAKSPLVKKTSNIPNRPKNLSNKHTEH